MAVPFAEAPGLASNNILDFMISDNLKLYKEATRPLADELFHCDAPSMPQFLKDLEDRGDKYNWTDKTGNGILIVNTNPGVAGAPEVDMIKSYGSITLETI